MRNDLFTNNGYKLQYYITSNKIRYINMTVIGCNTCVPIAEYIRSIGLGLETSILGMIIQDANEITIGIKPYHQ